MGPKVKEHPPCSTCTAGGSILAPGSTPVARRSWVTTGSTTWTRRSITTSGPDGSVPRRVHSKWSWKRPRVRTCTTRTVAGAVPSSPLSSSRSGTATAPSVSTNGSSTFAPVGTSAVLDAVSKYSKTLIISLIIFRASKSWENCSQTFGNSLYNKRFLSTGSNYYTKFLIVF